MKIITRGVIDWATLKVEEEDSFEYEGPLSLAAYAVTNPPAKISSGPLTDFGASTAGSQIWLYKSADAIATVKAANYISNAVALGMQVGDPVLVVDTTTPALSLAFVLSVNAVTGTATLDATPLTAT